MLTLLATLSPGHKIGLAVVAAVFVGFALSASFLAPRRWPDFPGRNTLSVFVIASVVLFAGMLAAVYFFGKEPAETAKAAESPAASTAKRTITVTESEFKIQLAAPTGLSQGSYTFTVHNAGKIPHDLAIEGGKVTGKDKTPAIPAGGDATLTVSLGPGDYTLYCTVPGHRALGMQAKLSVG